MEQGTLSSDPRSRSSSGGGVRGIGLGRTLRGVRVGILLRPVGSFLLVPRLFHFRLSLLSGLLRLVLLPLLLLHFLHFGAAALSLPPSFGSLFPICAPLLPLAYNWVPCAPFC